MRVNLLYLISLQLITANCVPIDQPDKMALNGVVHIVQGLLPTAENTVADIVGKNPELSTFKTSKSGSIYIYNYVYIYIYM